MRVRASGSFRRYAVDPAAIEGGARKLRDDGESLVKRLHANRFRSIDRAGSEVASVGWCRDDGTVPREFVAEDHWLAGGAGGPTLGAVLRIDRKRLPPGALRVRRMEAEAAERRNAGERIAPARRREIVEKIETELMARVVPSTALHRILWNLDRGELLLDATADASDAAVRALLRETFGIAPEPLVTATLAPRLASGKLARGLHDLAPAVFTAGGVALVGDSAAFLGREFLLWLWYACETADGKVALAPRTGSGGDDSGAAEVGIAFDQLLELGGAASGGKVSVRGDAPTRAPEAASALLGGKLPLRARLLLARGDVTFEVTLAGDRLDLEAIKVDAPADAITDEHLRSGDEQRARWLFELAELVDGLFAAFLALRLDRAFDRDLLPAMRDWIVARARFKSRAATG